MAKDAAALAQKLDNVELIQKILDLQRAALESEDNRMELRREVERLRGLLDLRQRLEFRLNAYWLPEENSPYCSRCQDADQKLVRLHTNAMNDAYFRCPSCDTSILRPGAKPPGYPIA